MNTFSPLMFKLANRQPRRLLLVEFNPYRLLAAELTQSRRGKWEVVDTGEFPRRDYDGLRRWLEAREGGTSGAATICSIAPNRSILQRESVQPARLQEPEYLGDLAEEQQKGRFLSATPFKIVNTKTWTIRAISALDGTVLPEAGAPVPALICALPNEEMFAVQKRLAEQRVLADRVEPGLLSLFGGLYSHLQRRASSQAVVVVVIHQSATTAYILGKEGVHTPTPIMHGLDSIIEIGRKELGEIDEAEVYAQLQIGNPQLVDAGSKLVRRIARDLKPLVDSFEMTTGQPVDEILCAYLPTSLNWIAAPLAQATGRTQLTIDFNDLLPALGVEVAEGGPTFGPHWLGMLSLAAHLPENGRLNGSADDPNIHRPWHVDCSVPMQSDERRMATRRLVTGSIAAVVAAFVLAVTGWQAYVTYALKKDTNYWEAQLASNRKLFEELNTATVALRDKTAALDRAYELMGDEYELSDLLMNLGRTIPARMRVERIQTNDTRVAISGTVVEPAEIAATTLGRHMDDIRRHAQLGPLFAHIAITSLQRKPNSDTVLFELTLRFKRSKP